ncbi:MAG: CBS domain-containing protein [Oligoflexia bacterium]|nr:CBS domain-containing protein [Oligoflexia bacterium]
MSTEVLTIQEGAPVEDVLKLLINHRITGIPVVNAKREMVGVVSEYDLMAQIAKVDSANKVDLSAPFEYTKGARTISTGTDLDEVVHQMLDQKFRRLPVVDEQNKLVGIITRRDIIRMYYYRARLT